MREVRIVIVGAGFAGIRAARRLGKLSTSLSPDIDLKITVLDKSNHFLFQPLLYQVATAGLSPANIAVPIRRTLQKYPNIEVLLVEVTGVDRIKREVYFGSGHLSFDYLIIATGARYNYFGKESEWEAAAPGLKTIPDALDIRQKILSAFESAEVDADLERRTALLTFVIVGGGPTGVELAGSIAELANRSLAKDFRHFDPRSTKILLLEASPKILAAFPDSLQQHAAQSLQKLGVEIRLGARVERIDAEGVVASGVRIPARTVLWAAGVKASPAGKWLGVETDRVGRVPVEADLSIAGDERIFVLGDTAAVPGKDGKTLPGVAPVAIQQGEYVAHRIINSLRKEPSAPFRYVDKGNLATIGRRSAIADFGFMRLHGYLAWLLWLFVHIMYLSDFRNRILVIFQWFWAYITFSPGARLITKPTVNRQEDTIPNEK